MAITFDAASTGTTGAGTTETHNHTVTGTETILFAGVRTISGVAPTSVTYNSVAMTLIATSGAAVGGTAVAFLYMLINPATGVNSMVTTVAVSTSIGVAAASYTGCGQTGQPDSTAVNNDAGPGNVTTLSQSTTVVASNCWVVMFGLNDNGGSTTAGTGSTERGDTAAGASIFDSAGTVPAGAYSMAYNGVSGHFGMAMASFAPPSTATFVPQLMTLGVG